MLNRKSALMVDMSEVLHEFEEISGWESLEDGLWNGRWNKEVAYEIEYAEQDTYQHEQDYVFFNDGPIDIRNYFDDAPEDGIIDLDFIKTHGE